MGKSKKHGRTVTGDFAWELSEETFFVAVDDLRKRAGLPEEAITAIEVYEWHGPGGGWPYIGITLDTLESQVKLALTWFGPRYGLSYADVLETLDFDDVKASMCGKILDAEMPDEAFDAFRLNKYERRVLDVILEARRSAA